MTKFEVENYKAPSALALLMGACALLGCGMTPTCEVSARLLGRAEILAYVHPDGLDILELADLESAIADYVYERGGRTKFQAVDFDRIVDLIGDEKLAGVALHRLGYFAQHRGDRIIWSNRPADGNTYRVTGVSFARVNRYFQGRGFS